MQQDLKTKILLNFNSHIFAGAAPYDSLQVADAGDMRVHMYNLKTAVTDIQETYQSIVSSGCRVIALGGDHTVTYPILQAVRVNVKPIAGWRTKWSTVKPVLRDHCPERPPVLTDSETTYFQQKGLHYNITEPVTRDHLS